MERRFLVRLAALLLWVAAIAFGKPVGAAEIKTAGAAPDIPAVAQGGSKAETLRATLKKIRLPAGFHIGLYAIVPDARHLAVAPNGAVTFVGTLERRVYAVVDHRKSGTADEVKPFASTIDHALPNGPCFAPDGTLYLAEQNRVLMFADAERVFADPSVAATAIVPQGELIPSSEESHNHSARVCRIGPDGKLYIALGQPYNVPPPRKLALYKQWGMGGIIRMDRDGRNREIYVDGIRNSVGLDFNPQDKMLWFTDNQVDLMGDDIPPGELNRATKQGQNFGFPWYGGGHTRTNEYRNETPPADLVFPEIEMVAHAADLGMIFYTGEMFPKRYRNAIFSAQHGSWNRTVPVGARVMVTYLREDGHAERTEPFAEGWLENGGYLGRPVDVAQLPDGALLVSDDHAGALYRIWYDGK
jgi:glucose/arabinose dehydrogenase